MFSNYLLRLYILLLHLPHPLLASTPGTLALFIDVVCGQASIINPTVNLPVDTCLVTPGASGIAVETLPPCTIGNATLILYRDKSCAKQDTSGIKFDQENCYFDGPNVPAVMFACKQDAKGTVATATTTASAGSSILPVAPGSPATPSPGGPTDQATPTSNGASTTSTTNPSPIASNSSPTKTPSADGSSGGSGSGLSQKEQIIVGIVVPVAAIVVALLAWWFPCMQRKRRHDQAEQHQMMHSPPHGFVLPAASAGENPDQGPRSLGWHGYEGRPW